MFQCFNENGNIQFDANLMSYGFREKHEVLGVADPHTGFLTFTVDVFSPVAPMLFVHRSDNDPYTKEFAYSRVEYLTGLWRFQYYCAWIPSMTRKLMVYIFDRMQVGGNFGLQTFDTAGNITFNTNQIPLRIAGMYSPPAIVDSNGSAQLPTTTWTLPPGRTYAVNTASLRMGLDVQEYPAGGSPHSSLLEEMVSIDGNILKVAFFFASDGLELGNAPGRYYQGGRPLLTVADVTGL
ncbi:TPA: hypothetical protein SH377_002590 [Pseudomonas aeruginosa]|uniref:hypothetical protein n=1 Tax=Pseudomonas aeruginosa TaxID=287 RepID=UPI000F54C1E1|nr:hypothetical protein [Pseudomonas aeruginosa]HCA5814775.1 hypothetical protein [Pseudomonas aeruginosa]HEH8648375.1 hypothetical protein [Pseudomonas aeruginosa]